MRSGINYLLCLQYLTVHPGTMKAFGPLEPLGFLEFLQLEAGARLVLTDSGGVQEEACILGVPCVTLLEDIERPDTLKAGSNVLASADALRMIEKAKLMMGCENGWRNPFGDGRAGESILEHLTAC
ncbi:MAG: UDP-N-acetylglucosamine 2-epimerase [Methanothrix sp.]|nr:UDP-N-acetylglucosamine 2-epimerase [Methanothrix sp.]